MTGRGLSANRRQWLLHGTRILLLAVIVLLIHEQSQRLTHRALSAAEAPDVSDVQAWFPNAASFADAITDPHSWEVLDQTGDSIGTVLHTSPACDHVIGFSGPTSTRIALTNDDRIAGLKILNSLDTPEHVAQVVEDPTFLSSFSGLRRSDAALQSIDAVSGATLTSLAVQEAVIQTLSGQRASLRFPRLPVLDDVRPLFESAASMEQVSEGAAEWQISDQAGELLGTLVRSSPASDNIIGYQGPTETLIGLDPTGRVTGILVNSSYDNEPYVGWVREDASFQELFRGQVFRSFADPDSDLADVEGVSGATMTSQAIAQGLAAAARQRQEMIEAEATPIVPWGRRELSTAAVILFGILIALTRPRRRRGLRVAFQIVLIGYLGLINGEMLSQAMLVGWAQSGIPWQRAGGLVLLTLAAISLPVVTRRNVYCTHLCPHGAVQQLTRNRLPWRLRLSRRLTRVLRLLPVVLLVWCVVVAMTTLPFSLVDIEPFNAWLFQITGWASLAIAVGGLIASLFVPMAYCRFGCPTGATLSWLRLNGRSDQWTRRDWAAVGLVLLACGIRLMS